MFCEASPNIDLIEKSIRSTIMSLYGNERLVALVLWEMTWLGFDDETIQENVKSWDEDLEN